MCAGASTCVGRAWRTSISSTSVNPGAGEPVHVIIRRTGQGVACSGKATGAATGTGVIGWAGETIRPVVASARHGARP